jgi:hypothetical protein
MYEDSQLILAGYTKIGMMSLGLPESLGVYLLTQARLNIPRPKTRCIAHRVIYHRCSCLSAECEFSLLLT